MAIVQSITGGFLFPQMMAAAPAAGQQGGGMQTLIMLVLMIVIFYFLLIRPQNKRAKEHRELVGNLKSGDEIITSGGVVGKITDVKEHYLRVEVADGVSIVVQRQHVGVVLPKDTIKNLDD